MAVVFYNQNPTIDSTILFDLITTDVSGTQIDVYEVVNVTIYYIERSRNAANPGALPVENSVNNFLTAVPVAVFGDETTPAWTVIDPGNSILTKEDFDAQGNPQEGVYRLTWFPDLVREGDFVVCYKWIAMPAGDEQLNSIPFYILGDTAVTTVIPTHYTVPGKYEMLINRYLPQTYKTHISDSDITPEMLEILNKAIAKGFTNIEDLANQIIDLFDANAVKDRTLPYLANLFNLKLRSSDTQLWRRQIKEAVPLFKQKGTLIGLKSALSAAGINLLNLTQLWQVKSSAIWTDAFFVSDSNEFVLTKLAILPIDPNNFEVSIRFSGDSEYQSLSSDYVSLQTVDGKTVATWVGDQLSFDPINLSVGDVVKILYKIGPIIDQDVEDYIKTLPLFDLRPEEDGLLPVKNWNVKVVEETDDMFPLLCPVKHPFTDPVVWGKVRTEMVYSEKAYNMDAYSGCCVGDTLVTTNNGIKKIKDITNDEFILTEYGMKKFDKLINQGFKNVLKIKTKLRREITVTENHKFKIINDFGNLEWKEACELKENDFILCKRGNDNSIPKNKGLDRDLWYLVGFAYGDGFTYNEKITWLFPEGEEESGVKIGNILSKYNAKYNIFTVEKDKNKIQILRRKEIAANKKMFRLNSSRIQLPEIDKILPKYQKKGKWKKNLPEEIWNSGEDQMCSFLQGLFDTDGGVQRARAAFTTKWHSLAKEVQQLLMNLGMISSITYLKGQLDNGDITIYSRVTVIGSISNEIYKEKINFSLSEKKFALENNYISKNVTRKEPTIFQADRTIIPYADKIIKGIFPTRRSKSDVKVCQRSNEENSTQRFITRLIQGYQKTLPDNRVNEVVEKIIKYGDKNEYYDFIVDYSNNLWFFDKVKSIEQDGEQEVFDPLNVDETHSYISNGFVSHNSLRDSTEPCSMDKSWQEPCSCCLSSKFVIDLEVSDFSGQRMTEAEEILNEYKPFHAVPHRINFLSGVDDFILSPQEDIEFLINLVETDNVLMTQDGFNRLIPEGTEQNSQEPNRSSLATTTMIYSGSGVGTNDSVVFYCPGVDFRSLPLDTNGANLLEILAGSDMGRYEVEPFSSYLVKLIQGSPDSTSDPLDMSEVPYRLSNVLHSQNNASIYQDNAYSFYDENLDTLLYPIQPGWKIVVTSGIYAGSYNISGVNVDNTISLSSFPANSSNLNYQLQTNTFVVVHSGSNGSVSVENRGRVELDSVVNQINSGDYVEYSGNQYLVISSESDLIISGYSGGNVVGAASVNVLRRLSFGVGFLNYNGMVLSGVIPSVDNTLENDKFLENYTILIGSNYYQIESINGSDMVISGPMLFWGLSGTSVPYSIVQYIKTSPYTVPTTGVTFDRLDRRGNDQVTIESQMSAMPMWSESFGQGEQVNITIEYR